MKQQIFLFGILLSSLLTFSCKTAEDEIKTSEIRDNAAPAEVSNFNANTTNGNAILKWIIPNDTDYAGIEISCEPAAGTLSNPIVLGKNTKSISLFGFEIGKTYVFKARTFDTNLNYSNGISVESTVLDTNDYDAPSEINNLTVMSTDGNAFLIWDIPADEDYAGVEISCEPAAGTLSNPIVLGKNAKSISLSGFEIGKTYIFKARTFDTSLNYSNGLSVESSVKDTKDYIAPQEITKLVAENLDGAVKLSWADPDDEDLFGIEITYTEESYSRSVYTMPEKSIIISPNTCYAIINNLQNDKTYTFAVKSIDLNGNKSEGVSIDFTPSEIKKCVVIFKTDNNPIYKREILVINNMVEKPQEPEITGYIFKGWFEDEDFKKEFDFEQLITTDLYIYAKFIEDIRYTISFKTLGGSTIADLSILNGQSASLPDAPQKKRAVFQGWYTSENYDTEYDFSLPVTSDITLYAKWEDVLVVEGSKGLDYEISEETAYEIIDDYYCEVKKSVCTITGIGECTDSIVYIPKSIAGCDVTAIAELAFENCTSVTKFIISSTVQSIGNRAFKDCSGITEITIPENVTNIGDQIFYNCTSLETIYCNSSAGRQSMWQNPSVKKVIFGDNLTSIPDSFRNCTNIEYVKLSKNTTFIGNRTFDGCINLDNMDFPEGITELGWYAFEDCKFTKFIIPSSITRLDHVVRSLPYLEYIIAPLTLRYVLGQSFDCTHTGYKTFYLGTETDWSYISISEESTFGNDVYFYSETQPTETGKYWHYNSDGEPKVWE